MAIDQETLDILATNRKLLDAIADDPSTPLADSTTTETSETTELSENTEASENTEHSENKEGKEGTEDTEGSEDSESSEVSENSEDTENSESTENSEDTENAEGEADILYGPLIYPTRPDFLTFPEIQEYKNRLSEMHDVLKSRYSTKR